MSCTRRLRLIGTFLLVPATLNGLAAFAAPIDFAHDIIPILQKHCADCHSGREAKGSFSFNTRELLVDSGHVVSGDAESSYLIDLISSDDADTQMPPQDRPRVSPEEVETLKRWIEEGTPWEAGFTFAPQSYEPPLHPRRPVLPPAVDGRTNPIDRILDAYLDEHGLPTPAGIDDATFLRRASLDLVGLLPEPERLNAFLASKDPNKREAIVQELLSDNIDYADHWLTFFNDLLRNDYTGTGFITGGRSQISAWLYDALRNNMPFDQFSRELIAPPTSASQGYIDGIQWRGEVSAGQTVEIQFAQSISQSFLGINLKCASCHDSFIDRWKLDESYGLAAIYAEGPLEVHRCDKPIGRTATAAWLFPELGTVNPEAPRKERLTQLAALMTHPENGRFARTIVNRLWYRLMGRGIVHPLDAMQTEPWNEDLLDYLAVHLADNGYDLKSVLTLIATSQAYQSQCQPLEEAPKEDDYVYTGPRARRMTAEQFIDGIWQLTDAGPTMYEAPVFRDLEDPQSIAQTELQGRWMSISTEQPAAKQHTSYFVRKTFKLHSPVRQGGAVIVSDTPFALYVNSRLVLRGNGGRTPTARTLHDTLEDKSMAVFQGGKDSFIVLLADADPSLPQPPQIYFEADLLLEDGEELRIASDDTWVGAWDSPEPREGLVPHLTDKTQPVVLGELLANTNPELAGEVRPLLASAITDGMPMVRASLMKNDFLMKSLGRPGREQIVSMRPNDLTTLEAIHLSNGPELSSALKQGAEVLIQRFPDDPRKLAAYLYEYALSRSPTDAEWGVLTEVLGDHPDAGTVADLLWSVCMSPEFLLVR